MTIGPRTTISPTSPAPAGGPARGLGPDVGKGPGAGPPAGRARDRDSVAWATPVTILRRPGGPPGRLRRLERSKRPSALASTIWAIVGGCRNAWVQRSAS